MSREHVRARPRRRATHRRCAAERVDPARTRQHVARDAVGAQHDGARDVLARPRRCRRSRRARRRRGGCRPRGRARSPRRRWRAARWPARRPARPGRATAHAGRAAERVDAAREVEHVARGAVGAQRDGPGDVELGPRRAAVTAARRRTGGSHPTRRPRSRTCRCRGRPDLRALAANRNEWTPPWRSTNEPETPSRRSAMPRATSRPGQYGPAPIAGAPPKG